MMILKKNRNSNLVKYSKLLLNTLFVFAVITSKAITLDDAIQGALKLDPTLQASKLNYLSTKENVSIARARFLPQIMLQGSSNQLTQTTTQDLATGGSNSRSFTGPSVNHQFVVRQTLFRPKDLSYIRYAELQTQYMEIKYRRDTSELKTKVVNAWIELLGAQEIAQAYQQPIELMKYVAKQEWAKFEQGESTKDVVMEADSQYENAKATYIQALEILKLKKFVFERITGISGAEIKNKKLELVPHHNYEENGKDYEWKSFLESSLELKMANLLELMHFEKVNTVEADHKPTLDLLATVNLAQNDATSTQGYQYKNKQIGLQYLIPLYAGGGTAAASRQAILNYQVSQLESEVVLRKIETDFNNAWNQIVGGSVKIQAMIKIISATEENVAANKRSFELGIKTIGELSISEMIRVKKRSELISALQDYSIGLNAIKKFNYSGK